MTFVDASAGRKAGCEGLTTPAGGEGVAGPAPHRPVAFRAAASDHTSFVVGMEAMEGLPARSSRMVRIRRKASSGLTPCFNHRKPSVSSSAVSLMAAPACFRSRMAAPTLGATEGVLMGGAGVTGAAGITGAATAAGAAGVAAMGGGTDEGAATVAGVDIGAVGFVMPTATGASVAAVVLPAGVAALSR